MWPEHSSGLPQAPCSSLDGRVAVVRGGAKGSGWATLEALMEVGAVPVLPDRDAAARGPAERERDEKRTFEDGTDENLRLR